MGKRYSIGFLLTALVLFMIIGIAYDLNYKTVKEKIGLLESEIRKAKSDYDKHKILHDYIIKNMEYDNDFVENISEDIKDSFYMSFVKGKGVCFVYAEVYQYLCEYFGLESWIVEGDCNGVLYEGDVPSWMSHTWNIVRIDGKFYHVDVTWDDPVGSDSLIHDYFLVSDSAISADHKWGGEEYGEIMYNSTGETELPLCPVSYRK